MHRIDERIIALKGQTKFFDWLTDLAILLVAVVLGLYLFWAPNATWGQLTDILVAGLWGLGLHTVTATQKFAGLGNLKDSIGQA